MDQPFTALRRVATASIGLAVAGLTLLSAAAPAAADTTVPLNPAHAGATADGFGEHDCSDFSPQPAAGEEGWHFVTPSNEAFVSLDLTFDIPGLGVTPVHIPGSYGSIKAGDPSHAYVYTPTGSTLLSGTAQVAGDVTIDKFNLSHTCPGTPPQSPSPSPEESPSPSGSESPSPGAPGTGITPGASGKGAGLPITGVAVTGAIVAALALLGAGVALMMLARRRSSRVAR